MITAGTYTGVIQFFDVDTGKMIESFTRLHDNLSDIAFVSAGEVLVSRSLDGSILLWDVKGVVK